MLGILVVLQRRVPPLVVVLIAAVFVTSLVAALDARAGGALYDHLALVPMHVWRGQVWRLVTWVLVERSPVSLLFAAIALYRFGGDLVLAWGQGRFGRFVAAIVLIAGYSWYMALIKRRNRAREALSSIDVQLRKRADLEILE